MHLRTPAGRRTACVLPQAYALVISYWAFPD